MKTNNISKIIKRYLSDRFPKKTEERVQRWIIADNNTKEKEDASLEYWNELKTEIDANTYSSLKRVNRRIGYSEKQLSTVSFNKRALQIAAILIPLFMIARGYYYHTQTKLTEVTVAYGETRHLFLPDSSEIWINAGSHIKYPKTFNDKQRLVYLEGEAYFSVRKDQSRPFIVKTEQLSVKVIGTKFNVKAYPEDELITTTLTSGKVEIITPTKESKILQPNEQLTYNTSTSLMHIENISSTETNAWLSGQLLFINSSFKDIKQTLERRFNVIIEDKAGIPASKLYTAKFMKGETLNEILNVLEDVVGFSYRQQGKIIVISETNKAIIK